MNLPDARGWAAIAAWILAVLELAAFVWKPALGANDLFKYLVQSTLTGGLLLVFSFYFGGSHKDPPTP